MRAVTPLVGITLVYRPFYCVFPFTALLPLQNILMLKAGVWQTLGVGVDDGCAGG